jgi:hypothetical protein
MVQSVDQYGGIQDGRSLNQLRAAWKGRGSKKLRNHRKFAGL